MELGVGGLSCNIRTKKVTKCVIAGLTRNPMKNAQYPGDCGSEAAMTGLEDGSFPVYPG